MLLALFLATAATIAVAPFAGMKTITPAMLFDVQANQTSVNIFWTMRVPRVLVGFLVGASLAISGMAFQAIFRNALATPFTLGVSSGASLGAAAYVKSGMVFAFAGISGITFFSFGGALASITLVFLLTRLKKGSNSGTMLLAGVAVSFFFSSLILFMQYVSDFTQSFRILRWLMGQLSVSGFEDVYKICPFTLLGGMAIMFFSHELNLLATGEELAISRGADVGFVKHTLFIVISLMIGGVVSVCGPIGFVGMMAPHICRLIIGADHRFLAPASFLFGGVFLTLCDTLARVIIAPAEIPVGIITSLLGGPFFMWLLVRRESLL